jgi:hypothetical protein
VTEDTDPMQGVDRIVEAALALACWALAMLGILCEVWPVLPAVAHEHVAADERITDLIGIGGMALMGPLAYLIEWADRHDRLRAKFWRRMGWLCQAFILLINILGSATDHKYALIVLTVICSCTGAIGWSAWMRTQFLPPEDQAVVDELIIDRDRRIASAAKAADQRRREERLQRAISRFHSSGSPTIPAQRKPEEPEAYPWPIPEGKHRPYVYFVRNGDRVKIGTTTNLRNRISSLSLRTSDIVLLLLGDRHGEQGLHRRFAAQRIGNTEWFHYTGAVAEYVATETAKTRAADKQKG